MTISLKVKHLGFSGRINQTFFEEGKTMSKESPAEFKIKGIDQIAIAVEDLELVQPVDGLSIYRDWVDERGEGFHHVNFLVDF